MVWGMVRRDERVVDDNVEPILPACSHKLGLNASSNGIIHRLVQRWSNPSPLSGQDRQFRDFKGSVVADS